jgi:Histidine kinase-, DNA gyrase B-, and HSP90-like ATPase
MSQMGIEDVTIEASGVREIIDVRPHPRLLAVLGDIEFTPWQCLAELVDNAFDDFVTEPPAGDAATVAITLPGRGSRHRDAQVWVTDNGRGMTLEHLNGALSAGWTSNGRYGKLGLFGMGFNIATARLGTTTSVRTTRAGDAEWISVTLDLPRLAASDDFLVPVRREPKADPAQHGTEIIISGLKPEQHDALSRQRTKIRSTLGDVYSYLLREKGFRLLVDGQGVEPRRPCVWGRDRAVVVSGERFPAYVEINEELAPLAACQDCGRWQDTTARDCEECGSDRLEVRERRIHGWLGVQRYLHKSDYGIDFLRNGRKILIRDIRLFSWEDPDDPGARAEQEYPIEVPPEGRIVGEIHINHVGVNYQKNAFEYETPEWKKVVRTLRGGGPLRPEFARNRGYPTNTSPLGRLFTGYRRNDPGLKRLIPGDGKRAVHEKAREWGKLFHEGDPEYRTDERWYQAAWQHDNPAVEVPPEGGGSDRESRGDARDRLDIPVPTGGPAGSDLTRSAPAPRQTEDEKQAVYRDHGEVLPDVSGQYGLPGFGAALDVTVWSVRGLPVRDSADARVPAHVVRGRGSAVEVFLDAEHPLFTEFAMDPRDLAVTELAEHLRVRMDSGRALSAVIAELKERCLSDHKITPANLAAQATALLDQVRDLMLPVIAGNTEGFWAHVTADERAVAERRFAVEGGDADWSYARASGEWVRHVPPSALARIVQQRPADFLDGRAFRPAYGSFEDAHARALTVNRIVGYLNDVGVLAEHHGRRRAEELIRGRLSCLLLGFELAPEPDLSASDE